MNQCPVCEKSGVAEGISHCPQCNADLECFQLLDDLDESRIKNQDNSPNNSYSNVQTHRGTFAVVFIALFMLTLFALQTYYFHSKMAPQTQQIHQLSEQLLKYKEQYEQAADNRDILNKMSSLEQSLKKIQSSVNPAISKKNDSSQTKAPSADHKQLLTLITKLDNSLSRLLADTTNRNTVPAVQDAARKPEQKPEQGNINHIHHNSLEFISYRSKESDTLWSISKHFYGMGIYYPVILKINPGLTIYNHENYGIIKIIKGKSQLMTQYQQLRAESNE